MASSAQNHHHHHLPNLHAGGATSAPPPTPSAQHNGLLTTADAADSLSRLLHRHLPPALSLPTNRRAAAAAAATCPPVISLSDETAAALSLFTSAFELGFFQLSDHSVPSELARSAESEALTVFGLSRDEQASLFPNNWPLGFDDEDEDGESLCLDSACTAESGELSLPGLRELTRELERVGLRVVELLAGSVGFERPERLCTLTGLSEDSAGKKGVGSGGFYPYVVGLEYQIRTRKYSLLADSGLVTVLPRVDSVLVTTGDIAQVWSNGKLKKVRGRPVVASSGDIDQGINSNNNPKSISMTVLITLPLDSTVSSLIVPKESTVNGPSNDIRGHSLEKGLEVVNEEGEEEEEEEISGGNNVSEIGGDSPQREKSLFKSFAFEDYAWRVYHERLPLKDPLDRYRFRK